MNSIQIAQTISVLPGPSSRTFQSVDLLLEHFSLLCSFLTPIMLQWQQVRWLLKQRQEVCEICRSACHSFLHTCSGSRDQWSIGPKTWTIFKELGRRRRHLPSSTKKFQWLFNMGMPFLF